MNQELLLESYLKDLRLSRFVQSYQSLAQEAARTNLSYERYLLALAKARSGPSGSAADRASHSGSPLSGAEAS